jgi:hypothetical protein
MRSCLLLALLILAAPAAAHDLWLARDGDTVVLRYGHRDGHGHGAGHGDLPAAAVAAVIARNADGALLSRARPDTVPARWPATPALCVVTTTGMWTKTPYGTENRPPRAGEAVVESWESWSTAKRLDAWHPRFAEAMGTGLEIVPVEDPLVLAAGDKLRLRVVLDGRPVEGAVVSYEGEVRGASDAAGRVNLRLRHGGETFVSASWQGPGNDVVDAVVHETSLVFAARER